ncbi:MAG TPA: hypothetical protein VN884_01860 [Candidatus Sulfotelmatobacter sp.]|nr:hypothetical protein [Candidatus Sulfotelmatobacter sp.]
MDVLAMYNSALQVAAAFLIFIVGYLALLIIIVLCLLVAEGVRQGFIFARTSLTRSEADTKEPEIVDRKSVFVLSSLL